jgi:Polyketide cyclase / dehydrase and lipid transport
MTITKTVNIQATTDKVWNYVNDLSKWAEWAIHNVIRVRRGSDEFWLMDGPGGTSKVKMNSQKATGLLDHDFIDPGEGYWTVSCRVVEGNLGAHFMITFTKPAQMPDEAFEMGMKLLDEELLKLKEVLENESRTNFK